MAWWILVLSHAAVFVIAFVLGNLWLKASRMRFLKHRWHDLTDVERYE